MEPAEQTPSSGAAGGPAGDQPAGSLPDNGLTVVHLFGRTGPGFDASAASQAIERAAKDGVQVIPVAMLGHKADLGLVLLGEDPWTLREVQSDVQGAGLELTGSYVSLTEVSEYAAGIPVELLRERLRPTLPPAGKPAFCFYPMSKRRGDVHNWYELGFDERRELMIGHGRVGRTFRGRVLQLVTGSTGLDDWEWGVTLFAERLDDLKDCVYQMRFDEASARYAEFGAFWTGMVADTATVLSRLAR